MPLWKLMPLDLSHPSWAGSTYRGEMVARARNERTARRLAVRATGLGVKFELGRDTHVPPWTNSALVSCEPYSGGDIGEEGPGGVIRPAHPDAG